MSKNAGPKPGAEQPPKVENKPKEQKEESNILKGSQLEKLGGVIAYDLKQLMTIFGKFYAKMLNFDTSTYLGIKNPREQRKALSKLEAKIEVPKIKNVGELKTTIEKPKPKDSLVAYLYRALNVPIPKLSEVKPKTDKIKLPHLTKQLKESGVYAYEGKNAIMSHMLKKPTKYRIGDLVVLQGTNGEFTAGLILAINDKEVVFQNNELSPVKRSTNEIFLAYHFNKNTKKIPEKLEKAQH